MGLDAGVLAQHGAEQSPRDFEFCLLLAHGHHTKKGLAAQVVLDDLPRNGMEPIQLDDLAHQLPQLSPRSIGAAGGSSTITSSIAVSAATSWPSFRPVRSSSMTSLPL